MGAPSTAPTPFEIESATGAVEQLLDLMNSSQQPHTQQHGLGMTAAVPRWRAPVESAVQVRKSG